MTTFPFPHLRRLVHDAQDVILAISSGVTIGHVSVGLERIQGLRDKLRGGQRDENRAQTWKEPSTRSTIIAVIASRSNSDARLPC
jgi:hypothetical protein